MDLTGHIKDHWSEQRTFTIRVVVAAFVAVGLILFLVSRLFVLQVLGHEYFTGLSQGNRVRIEPIPPTRGLVYDRNGVLLAENVPTYQLEFTPEQVPDIEQTLTELTRLGLMDEVDRERVDLQIKKKRRFDSIPVRYRLNEEQVALFAVERPRFPGVDIKARLARHYPLGGSSVHAIGYVGSITTADIKRLDPASYANTTHVGRIGVERAMEEALHGEVGYRTTLVNARGRRLPYLIDGESESPEPGWDLHLNFDANLQAVAEKALGDYRGAVVAIDPRNGEVLTMVSAPSYDPNPFGEGLSSSQFRALQTDNNRPMFNRALLGRYPPGSTIKPILALAGLSTGVVSHTHTSWCPGFFQLPHRERRYRDWKPAGHGWVDMDAAITQSCDVFFYKLAVEMGIDEMHRAMTGFGLGSITGVEIGENSGLVPSKDWKRGAFSRREDQVWFPGETVITGIGQGFTLVTPMQLAHAAATLANRGERYRPRLIRGKQDRETGEYQATQVERLPTPFTATEEQWDTVIGAMENVVHGPKGTARAIAPKEYRMAGKSGTAQVISVGQEEEYDAEAIEERHRDHALFIAFAPVEEPTIAVAVILENAGSGSGIAAPVAKAVIDARLLENTQ